MSRYQGGYEYLLNKEFDQALEIIVQARQRTHDDFLEKNYFAILPAYMQAGKYMTLEDYKAKVKGDSSSQDSANVDSNKTDDEIIDDVQSILKMTKFEEVKD